MPQSLLLSAGPLVLGFLLDQLLGDPPWLYHPVRWMGNLIVFAQDKLRAKLKPGDTDGEFVAGVRLAVICICLVYLLFEGVLLLAGKAGMWVAFALQAWVGYRLLAARDLYRQSMRVCRWLEQENLPEARRALAQIVGRDTAELDEAAVARAAVETVAENTTDGVVAPLFYLALGGGSLAAAYKMVSTLDSMVGYKNERCLHFGRAAAKIDDAACWIPARFATMCMVAAAWLCGLNAGEALRIWRRDRRNHASPNSAQTEAACAGALGLRLGGGAFYGGVWIDKPAIGDDGRQPTAADIRAANRLMLATSCLALAVCAAVRAVWIFAGS